MVGGHIEARVDGNVFPLAGGGDSHGDNCCYAVYPAGRRGSPDDKPMMMVGHTCRGDHANDVTVCRNASDGSVASASGRPRP